MWYIVYVYVDQKQHRHSCHFRASNKVFSVKSPANKAKLLVEQNKKKTIIFFIDIFRLNLFLLLHKVSQFSQIKRTSFAVLFRSSFALENFLIDKFNQEKFIII